MRISFFLACAVSVLFSACPEKKGCQVGELDCACIDGASCNAGLACGQDLVCKTPIVAGVQFGDSAARGCELLITEAAGTEVASVEFKNGAKGTWIRQAPQVAITVVSGADTPLAGSVVIGLNGAAGGLELVKSACVDVNGRTLSSTPSLK